MDVARRQFTIRRMLGATAIIAVACLTLRWGFHDFADSPAQPALAVIVALPIILVSVLYLCGQPLGAACTTVVLWSAVLLMATTMAMVALCLIALFVALAT